MVTGSVASSAHGKPRSTRDIDIVIAPNPQQLRELIEQFPSTEYYADEQQALDALTNKSQFNVIDFSNGWKIDFIIAKTSEYARTALSRRKKLEIGGALMLVASPEDVILSKMEWVRLSGGSDRQMLDAADIVRNQGHVLDRLYVEHWANKLGLQQEWKQVLEASQ
jgi:hypothetical protein